MFHKKHFLYVSREKRYKMSKTQKQKTGKIGEDIACKFLFARGFTMVERNYWKKWGEIDVIIEKDNILHFVEVKTVSHIPGENKIDKYRPEENIHPRKIKRLSRTIQTYLLEKNIPEYYEWHFDAVIVFLNQDTKKAKVRFLENIII